MAADDAMDEDEQLGQDCDVQAKALATRLGTDVIAYYGPIYAPSIAPYLRHIEALAGRAGKPDRLAIVLTTPGGVVEVVEKLVEITRHHYAEVDFYVPDYAMSAGTIWCMSGDRIFMDYAASLGPVDPQVQDPNNEYATLVPALGILEQYEVMIAKSAAGTLTAAEQALLHDFNQGELNRYKQARELSNDLIRRWLAERHPFGGPDVTPELVTPEQRQQKADAIAKRLSDHTVWHSHNRMIGMKTLRAAPLGLAIADMREDRALGDAMRAYGDSIDRWAAALSATVLVHGAQSTGTGEPA